MRRYVILAAAFGLTAGVGWGQQSESERTRLRTAIEQAVQASPMEATLALTGPILKNQPFTAEASTETIQTLADGTHVRQQSSWKLYRDSDGRMRREEVNGRRVLIIDPVSGVSYNVNIRTRQARKLPLGRAVAGEKAGVYQSSDRLDVVTNSAERSRGKTEDLGKQTMEGVSVDGARTVAVIAAGTMGNERALNVIDERWYSPELQVMVMSRHGDPRTGERVFRLTNIQRGQPDPSLFQVPAGYEVSDK